MTVQVAARDFDSFRIEARALLARHIAPPEVTWQDELAPQASLFAASEPREASHPAHSDDEPARVPRRFFELAERACLHRSDDRFSLLYRVLFRLTHGERTLLADTLDDDVRKLAERASAVRRDEHHMHAFLRFRETTQQGELCYLAWYAPEHYVLRLTAPFFARRFAEMRWSILTPDESVSWDKHALAFGPGAPRSAAPEADELESLFRVYYRATSNPARVNPALFEKHVPRAFRREMPELRTGDLSVGQETLRAPVAAETAAAFVPSARTLPLLRRAAVACTACPLAGPATQTVFGEGPENARLVLVGEQPGEEEDLRGVPFVGPAGRLLNEALHEAQITRDELYVTNAVKHFHHQKIGNKKRLHQKPEWRHVEACRPWLQAELEALQARVIVCLGATAGQSFIGRRFTLLKNRGRVFDTPYAQALVVTWHPSALLRMDAPARARAFTELVSDLRTAAERARLPESQRELGDRA